jgi:hypothetical protein
MILGFLRLSYYFSIRGPSVGIVEKDGVCCCWVVDVTGDFLSFYS